MAQPVIQPAFHAGELSPNLFARVDMAKYHMGAALMRNFFVDYRGGASTRTGTKYVVQAYKPSTKVRLIPFQASFTVNYVLEFGDGYIRFINQGAPVLESTFAITGATQANPCVLTVVGNNYAPGDWIFVQNVVGMTQLNNRFFVVLAVSGSSVTIGNILNGANINSTGYGAYSSGGTTARIYTLPSPYAAADLALIKYAQNVNTLILCHPNYVPYVLTINSAANWTINPVVFGTTVATPTIASLTIGPTTASNWGYSYIVTAVDVNGQESTGSTPATLTNKLNYNISTATVTDLTWNAVAGAQYYNIYRAQLSGTGTVPSGALHGLIAFAFGTEFTDYGQIAPDYSISPPVVRLPFTGDSVASVTVTTPGTYNNVKAPNVTFDAAPTGGVTAVGFATLAIQGTPTISSPAGSGYAVGDQLKVTNATTAAQLGNPILIVASVSSGQVVTVQPVTFPGSNAGAVSGSNTSVTPVNFKAKTGSGTGNVSVTLSWGVQSVSLTNSGQGYTTAPNVTFASGAAAATANLSQAIIPSFPIFWDQRLYLMGPSVAVNTFYASQPGSYYNNNVSIPAQADDGIVGTLVASKLNSIKSAVVMPKGLVILTDQQAWLLNGGSDGSAATALDATANSQAYNGISDIRPIPVNFDILYVQAKGSIVRDLTYNFYLSNYTGNDISVLSSHLFYGFTLTEWAYAEEPFKVVWAVRSDGALLSLTFVKEQEIIGWAHHDTTGSFQSIAAIPEQVSFGTVDAVYVVVQRTINGTTTQYIERFAERYFPNGAQDSWAVDAAIQYSGSPATTFTNLDHLEAATVTGTADGLVILPTTVTNGSITLSSPASKVTVGLSFTPQLQTMPIDLGEPTAQGKRKKITATTVRCRETFGLNIGHQSSSLVPMKDCANPTTTNAAFPVDLNSQALNARTLIDPLWDVPGQYLIQQSSPYPATILGVMPEIIVGDTPK